MQSLVTTCDEVHQILTLIFDNGFTCVIPPTSTRTFSIVTNSQNKCRVLEAGSFQNTAFVFEYW